MRRNWSCGLVVALLTVAAFSAPGFAVTITFDDVPAGTNIKTQYSALGVTFSCINGTDASFNQCSSNRDVVAALDAGGSASHPNVIGFNNATLSGFLVDERSGYFRADFATPQSFVSIDAIAVPPPERLGASQGGPFLQAFGTGGVFRGQDFYSNHNPIANCDDLSPATPCPYETLSVSRPTADITFVAFSSFFTTGGGLCTASSTTSPSDRGLSPSRVPSFLSRPESERRSQRAELHAVAPERCCVKG
jgi:hypothetical protein